MLSEEGPGWLDRLGIPGRFVAADQTVTTNEAWRTSLAERDMHLTSNPIDWYAARAAGIAAYVLLTMVVCLGLTLAAKAPGRRWPRWPAFAVEDVHRVGGLLVGTFIAIHIVTIAVDSFLPFSPLQLIVPLTAAYRPIWTGLGIAAAELLLALAVTNRYRRRLSHVVWRRAHYANFAVWTAATLHGMGSGTDRNAPAMMALYAVASAAVLALTTWRIAQHRPGIARPGLKAAVAGTVGAAAAVALMSGPLSPHNRPFNARTFSDVLTGTILQRSGSTKAIVSMTGNGAGRQNVLVRADLLVGASNLEATSFQLEFLPNGAVCRGSVTNVQSFGFDGVCRLPDHTRRTVHARWQLTSDAQLRGTLTANDA